MECVRVFKVARLNYRQMSANCCYTKTYLLQNGFSDKRQHRHEHVSNHEAIPGNADVQSCKQARSQHKLS